MHTGAQSYTQAQTVAHRCKQLYIGVHMCTVQSTHIVNIVRWTIPACRTILSPANRGLSGKKGKGHIFI